MREAEQKIWNEVIDTHWWARGHYRIIKKLIAHALSRGPSKGLECIDIGCSGGHMADFLGRYGRTWGIDISFDGLQYSKTKGNILQADASCIPFKNATFDLAVLLDVAEHIDDDGTLFREVARVCKADAIVIVNVPAFKSLWGSHDDWNGHKRRYCKKGLRMVVEGAGFRIEKMVYLHPHLFLPVYIFRMMGKIGRSQDDRRDDFRSFGKLADAVFYGTLVIEEKLISCLDFPFGTSLFCIMRKN